MPNIAIVEVYCILPPEKSLGIFLTNCSTCVSIDGHQTFARKRRFITVSPGGPWYTDFRVCFGVFQAILFCSYEAQQSLRCLVLPRVLVVFPGYFGLPRRYQKFWGSTFYYCTYMIITFSTKCLLGSINGTEPL